MDDQSNLDRLSNLPICLIHIILSFLPIRDAIKTCILARNWRYIWTTLSSLDFSKRCRIVDESRLGNFIQHTLSHHQGPIHKFKFYASSPEGCLLLDNWLLYLYMSDIKELSLKIPFSNIFRVRLHSIIYSYEKLTHLKLFGCELRTPPHNIKGLSSLKSLILHNVLDPYNVIRFLVSKSPLLEFLRITNGFGSPPTSTLMIGTQNLKYVELRNCMQICVFAPRVTQITVGWSEDDFLASHLQNEIPLFCNYSMFLGALCNLEKLDGLRLTKYLSVNIESCIHRRWKFHALKDIILHKVNFQHLSEILVVIRLLKDCPNLQTLDIYTSNSSIEYALEDFDRSFWNFGSELTFAKLRFVRMVSCLGPHHEMEFIKFLLKHSVALETLTICNGGCIEWLPKSLDELKSLSKAYPKVKVSLQLLSKRN